MSYFRRNTRRYREYKYYFSFQKIDHKADTLDVKKILLQEFFAGDKTTINKIFVKYFDIHGRRPTLYLKNKYQKWKFANYHLTDLIRDRLLKIIPYCLSEERRFYLLKHEVFSQINNLYKERIFTGYSNKKIDLSEIFEKAEEQIDRINNFKFSWFVNDNVYTKNELLEFKLLLKYILKKKLLHSFDATKKDINIFKPKVNQFKKAAVEARYFIDLLNIQIDLNKINKNNIYFHPSYPKLNFKTDFVDAAKEYLLKELENIRFNALKAEVDGDVCNEDLDKIFNQYKELAKLDNNGNISATLKGNGGLLKLNIEILSFKMSAIATLQNFVYLLLVVIIPLFVFLKYPHFPVPIQVAITLIGLFAIYAYPILLLYCCKNLLSSVSKLYKIWKKKTN